MGYSGKSQLANWKPSGGQTSGLPQEARASLHQASCHDGLGGRELGLLASDSRALKREREGGAGYSVTHKHKNTTYETITATLPRAQQTFRLHAHSGVVCLKQRLQRIFFSMGCNGTSNPGALQPGLGGFRPQCVQRACKSSSTTQVPGRLCERGRAQAAPLSNGKRP